MKRSATPVSESKGQSIVGGGHIVRPSSDVRFDRLTRLASELLSVPVSCISLFELERHSVKSGQGFSAEEAPQYISFFDHAHFEDKLLVVEDTLNDDKFADNLLVTAGPNIRFYAAMPLYTRGKSRIGTLSVMDTAPRALSQLQIELLTDLAATIEALIEADFASEKERKTLQEKERRAQLVLEGTRVGTWQWNVQSGETVFNERWAEIVGYTLAELEPVSIDTWMGLAHPDDLAESEAKLKAHFTGEQDMYDCKCRMRHKHGHWVWVHDRGRVVKWGSEGEPLLMFGTHADITDEMANQEKLQNSRNELASLIENMPGVTYRCIPDDNWTMLYISGQVDRVSGYAAEELIGNQSVSYAKLIHPSDIEAVTDQVYAALAENKQWHIEYRIKHRDGTWRWVEERGQCILDDGGHGQVLEGFIVDITREKQAITQLNKHHDALALLNEIAFSQHPTLDAKIDYALSQAKSFLKTDMAILSEIDGDVYTVRWVNTESLPLTSGQHFALGDTWCGLLFSSESAPHNHELFINDAHIAPFRSHPCYQANPLGAYAGVVIHVEGRAFGTLNFSSAKSRIEGFDETEQIFIRLLARWLADTLTSSLGNERLHKLMSQLPGIVYQFRQYPDGRMTFPFSSPKIFDIYGITPEQAADSALPAFARIHPNDLDSARASIMESAKQLANWNTKYRVGSKEIGYRWIAGQAKPERLQDGSILWHGFIQDIHEQEQARQAVIISEQRLRGLFEFSPIGIALNDFESGQFIDLNPALIEPTGFTRDEFVKLSYSDVTPEAFKAADERALKEVKATGRYAPYEKVYVRKDGSTYPVRVQGMISEEHDGRKVLWSLIEDISERRKLDKMKDQFIATVSHELRTPLTSIKGALDLLAGGAAGKLTEKAGSLIDNARRNSQRLNTLINDLLDMEQLVAGKMAMQLNSQLLQPVIHDVIDSMQSYNRKSGVSVVFKGERPDVMVDIDADRFSQALTNLLSNALKFSPDNSEVEVRVTAQDPSVSITVRDHGPGISPDFRDNLFKRFAQADGSDSRKLPGTGLGLSITREIIERQGGHVGYQDAEGGGSEFTIELPIIT